MGQAPIQIGWIPYLNLVPLYKEFQRLSGVPLSLVSGHPSSVSKWLIDGTIQLAPASSITLMKASNLRMAMPLGIASDGPVLSVYLGLQREHEDFWEFVKSRQSVLTQFFTGLAGEVWDMANMANELTASCRDFKPEVDVPQLLLTPASAASAALTEVLMYLWCGRDSSIKTRSMAKDHVCRSLQDGRFGNRAMELVIGDEALQRRHEFWRILDLGQIWREITGLPFVFGLWQTNCRQMTSDSVYRLMEAASIAQARMSIEPQVYFPDTLPSSGDGRSIDLAGYWRVIQYKLTARHFKSLLLYYHLCKLTVGIGNGENDAVRLATWSQGWPLNEVST